MENKIVAVYILFKDREIVYIGQTTDLISRLFAHKNTKDFDSFRYIKCPKEKLLQYERRLIKFFKPKLNNTHIMPLTTTKRIPLIIDKEIDRLIADYRKAFKEGWGDRFIAECNPLDYLPIQ